MKKQAKRIAAFCVAIVFLVSCDLIGSPQSICDQWLLERDVVLEQMLGDVVPDNHDPIWLRDKLISTRLGNYQDGTDDTPTLIWYKASAQTSFGCVVFGGSQRPNAFIELSADVSVLEPIGFRIIGPN